MGYFKDPGYKLTLVDLSDDTTIAPAGDDTQTLQAPAGKVYEIVAWVYDGPDPIGSGAGTHTLKAFYTTFTETYIIVQLTATTGNDLNVAMSQGLFGDSSEAPTNIREQITVLNHNWPVSNTYTISFKYDNDTDVNQTGTRTLKILVKEYSEVS